MIAGAMTLIVLQVFGSREGAARGGALMQWVSGGVAQLISPDKAAIPNLADHGQKKSQPAPQPAPSGNSSGAVDTSTLPRNPTLSA